MYLESCKNVASSVTTSLLFNNNLTMSDTTQIKEFFDDESEQKVQISNDSFNQALGRLEQEVLGMRNDLVGRLEATVNNSASDKRFQALEKLLKENIEQN